MSPLSTSVEPKSALKRSASCENTQESVKKPALRRSVSFGNLTRTVYSIYEPADAPKVAVVKPLREEERNAKEYNTIRTITPVPLEELKDHPKLCITMIQYTIWKTWYGKNDSITKFNGQYITGLLEMALSTTSAATCLQWLNEKVQELRTVTDEVSARQFKEIISQSGWIKDNPEVADLFNDIKTNTWTANQEREVQLQVPDLEGHFRAILSMPDVKAAIATFSK